MAEKVKIWQVIVLIVSVFVSGGSIVYGATQVSYNAQMEALSEKVDTNTFDIKDTEKRVDTCEKNQAVTITELNNIQKGLEKLDNKVDRVLANQQRGD